MKKSIKTTPLKLYGNLSRKVDADRMEAILNAADTEADSEFLSKEFTVDPERVSANGWLLPRQRTKGETLL